MNSSQVPRKSEPPFVTALTLIFFACLVLVPGLLQHEPLKWQAAQAITQHENGDRDAAIESLHQVASKLPGDLYIQSTLIDWWVEDGQADKAIEHCNERLEHEPGSSTWLTLRRESECAAGDFEAAWETYNVLQSLRTQHLSRSADELNEQAYFRALADKDLRTAKSEIQEAVTKASYDSGISDFRVPLPSQALLAAGLLSRQVEAQSMVLPQLNRRIAAVGRALEDRERMLVESLDAFSEESFPLSESQELVLKDLRLKIDVRRHEFAFLTVCRALMCEDLEHPLRCDSDRVQISELGLQPQMVADLLPDDFVCHAMAMRAIAFLDTRALVLTKMPWSDASQLIDEESTGQDAITDLDIAVTVCEVVDRLLQASKESTEQEFTRLRKVYAAVLHHRAMANRKAGNTDSLQLDRERIESLGFDPDGNLY